MFLGSFDDLFLSEAGIENFNKISTGASNSLNHVVRVELERKTETRALVVDPVVDLASLTSVEITGARVSKVGR